MRKNIFELRTLIAMALLAALGAVFSAFLSFELAPTGMKTLEVSLAPVAVMLAGIYFGPLAGFMVGFVADTAGFFMGVQHSAYNPLFSVTMGLFGVIAALFYMRSKRNTVWKVSGAVVTAQVTVSLVLNTIIIWLYYGVPLGGLVVPRLIGALIELPVYAWLLMVLVEALRPLISKRKPAQT